MKKITTNKIEEFWNNGFLYILLGLIIYLIYSASTNVGVVDWQKELTYFNYIKASLEDYHTLPYFWWNKLENVAWYPPIMVTAAFIAIPETPLFTPLIPLIIFISAIHFAKLYIFLMFVVGVAGVFKLKKQLNWSKLQFRTYIICFLFSPIIMQHLAVGYSPWINIFLFPWFIYFLAEKNFFRSAIGMAGTMSLVLLQGGIYTFIWLLMLLSAYIIINFLYERKPAQLIKLVAVPLMVLFLALVRIYSTWYAYAGFSREWFLTTGYNPFTFLAYALTPTFIIKPFDILFYRNVPGLYPGFPPHDAGLFWGFTVIMAAVMTLLFTQKRKYQIEDNSVALKFKPLFLASLIILTFSFYSIWALFTKALHTYLYLPFYESIKNYGFRLAVPAYLGITVVISQYVNEIWAALERFVKTIFWNKCKEIANILFKISYAGVILLLVLLAIFKGVILKNFHSIITKAYEGDGYNIIRQKMEGMSINSLEFYLSKADNLYGNIQYWFLIIALVGLCFLFVRLLLRKWFNQHQQFVNKVPYIKFELILAIPLIFSISMWTKLAISEPYTEFPVQKVEAPTVLINKTEDISGTNFLASPHSLIIKQKQNSKQKIYSFPQVLERDHKYLAIETDNANFINQGNELSIEASNSDDIRIAFKDDKIKIALYVTLGSWAFLLICFVLNKRAIKPKS